MSVNSVDTYKTPTNSLIANMNKFKLIATNWKCPAGTVFTHCEELPAHEWKMAAGGYLGRTEDGRIWTFLAHHVENSPNFKKL